jgi:hypothetical protein
MEVETTVMAERTIMRIPVSNGDGYLAADLPEKELRGLFDLG